MNLRGLPVCFNYLRYFQQLHILNNQPHCLGMNYYVNFLEGIVSNGQLKKSKSWVPFWRYQLNSTTDLSNLAQFWGKWVGLVVLVSWYLRNGSQDFRFFNCLGCRIFILCEIYWDPCPRIFHTWYTIYRNCKVSHKYPLLSNIFKTEGLVRGRIFK